MNSTVVAAESRHAIEMAASLRAADYNEIVAAAGIEDAEEALLQCLDVSLVSKAWIVGGRVACLYGLAGNMVSDVGRPWLLSTDLVREHRLQFLRGSRRELRWMLSVYPVLENYVDCRYVAAIRWLRWLGFRLDEPISAGPQGMLFQRFELRRMN